jgi:hypothetical protein
MAQAARSLSPKQILGRIRQHRQCVIVLAHQSARKAIKAQLRAEGLKLSQFSAKDISIRAEAWFDVHRQELIAEAEQIVATSPYFARWRLPSANITTVAQSENEPKSTTSAVQMSGAE